MRAGYKKDGDTFAFAALYNDHVLTTHKLRKLLEEEFLRGNLIQRYRRLCDQLHRRWPGFDPQPQTDWLREAGAEEPRAENANRVPNESVRRLRLLDRKLNYLASMMFSLVTVVTWVIVFFVVQTLLNGVLGSGWHGATDTIAIICALIAGGAAEQYFQRQFRKADP